MTLGSAIKFWLRMGALHKNIWKILQWPLDFFKEYTSGKHIRAIYTHLNPTLYRKAGVYLFFLFLLQNSDCGYSL